MKSWTLSTIPCQQRGKTTSKIENKKDPILVSYSPVKNPLKLAVQARSTIFYTLKCSHFTDSSKPLRAMVNKLKQKKKKIQDLQKEHHEIERSNWEEVSEVCKKQEKDEDRRRATALPRNAYFSWWK